MSCDERVAARTEKAIGEHVFPGCSIGIVRLKERWVGVFGRHTYEENSPTVAETSVYDCASITKSIPTATLALQLIDEEKLNLDDTLIMYIPEYRTRYRDNVTIRHLLTYTLGNTTPLSRAGATPEAIFETVCTEETFTPGTVFSYSNTPAFLLGIVIERIMGMPLDRKAQMLAFEPFGMHKTTFHPHGAVPTEEGIQDIVNDESARVFARAGRTVGHAGLFSTAPDLLKFCAHLLAHPDERLSTNQIAHLGASSSLGWELNQPYMGRARSHRTFGKTGFTGTSIVCDVPHHTAIVILSNRTFPKRPADTSAINAFRAAVCDIVFSS